MRNANEHKGKVLLDMLRWVDLLHDGGSNGPGKFIQLVTHQPRPKLGGHTVLS